jgi:hypothetical protein
MKAGLVRLGVTTTPEQAASASASSRMIGPAFSLIRMAWGVQKLGRSSRKILAWANGAARGPSTLVLAKWLGRRSCWATAVPANLQRDQEGRHAQGVAGIKSECRARGSQPRREDAVGARLADRPWVYAPPPRKFHTRQNKYCGLGPNIAMEVSRSRAGGEGTESTDPTSPLTRPVGWPSAGRGCPARHFIPPGPLQFDATADRRWLPADQRRRRWRRLRSRERPPRDRIVGCELVTAYPRTAAASSRPLPRPRRPLTDRCRPSAISGRRRRPDRSSRAHRSGMCGTCRSRHR